MIFRTVVDAPKYPFALEPGDGIVHLGSCFSQHMASQLKKHLFRVAENPFGTSFNPISIAQQIEKLLSPKPYKPGELSFHRGMFFSFDHYSVFSHPDKDQCLAGINRSLSRAGRTLATGKLLMITLGTAHAWKHKKSGKLVNNCHRLPGNEFERVLLPVDEIAAELTKSLLKLQKTHPHLHVLLSVSPVRHWRDGAMGNLRSKSHLIAAVHRVVEDVEQAHYFPSYEIMTDDLRDYRFYADDLLHPNELAVQYIWEAFAASVLSKKSRDWVKDFQPLLAFANHRPNWPDSPDHEANKRKHDALYRTLKAKYKEADWGGFSGW